MTPMAAVLVAAVVFSAFPPRIAAQRAQKDDRSWNTSHIALASAFSVALWIDASQTREAMRRGYRETNPILGPHPSVGQVNTYTAVAGLAVLGTAAALGGRVRPWLLAVALAVETFAITSTMRQGIAIRVP